MLGIILVCNNCEIEVIYKALIALECFLILMLALWVQARILPHSDTHIIDGFGVMPYVLSLPCGYYICDVHNRHSFQVHNSCKHFYGLPGALEDL